jgi:hypothetical protein
VRAIERVLPREYSSQPLFTLQLAQRQHEWEPPMRWRSDRPASTNCLLQEPTMSNAIRSSLAILIAGVAIAGSAHARYLCNEPPSRIDQRACEAAEEGPAVLRRFIDRMRPIQQLYFYDYVDQARLVAWDERDNRNRAMAEADRLADAARPR